MDARDHAPTPEDQPESSADDPMRRDDRPSEPTPAPTPDERRDGDWEPL